MTDQPTSLRFDDGTAASGLAFTHVPTRTARKLMPEVIGSGVVLADFNRDGAVDVVLVNGGQLGATGRPAGRREPPLRQRRARALPRRDRGVGTAQPRLRNGGGRRGLRQRRLDRLVPHDFRGSRHPPAQRQGRFVDVTRTAGIVRTANGAPAPASSTWRGTATSTSGWPVTSGLRPAGRRCPATQPGVRVYCTPLLYEGLPSRLLRNNGNGTFTDVSRPRRTAPGKGLALVIGDVDQDGDADVFVANDSTANHLWLNEGAGRLRETAMMAGVALSEMGSEQAGMGADMSDVDGDGRLDLR